MAKDSKIVGGLLKAESLAKILCAQTTEDFQTALNSLVLFDPGAEVSMHTSPTNSVGKLVPKPNVTLSGVFGGESGQQQGCCAQRLDTKDHEGKIVLFCFVLFCLLNCQCPSNEPKRQAHQGSVLKFRAL